MLTERQKSLLELLASQQDYQTVDFFSSKLGVSKRTIHSDLDVIKTYIEKKDVELDKKRGVGILLTSDNQMPSIKTVNDNFYGVAKRREQLMIMLLFDEGKVSFNFLADKFLVSKTSIINDLEFVMNILNRNANLQLKSDVTGTKLVGNEVDIQKGHLQFCRHIIQVSEFYSNESIDKKIKILEEFYGNQIITVCTNILYSFIRKNLNTISDHYIQNILNIFIVLVYRASKGYHILKDEERKLSNRQQFFDDSAVKIIHKASLRLGISYENADVAYLSHHLVSNRVKPVPNKKVDDQVVDRLIKKVSDLLNINFSSDENLNEQLKKHIPAMIYRLRSNNKTDNPFVNQIKQEFSLTFNIVWVAVSEFEKELVVTFNEEEIAFLTMYFQAAIERADRNKKILVICQMGIATSELLMNRMKNVIPSLDQIEVASVPELNEMDLNTFDLIISTIKVNIPNKHVIIVSPLLSNEDIEKIKQSGYEPSMVDKTQDAVIGSQLLQHSHPKFVFYNTNFTNKNDLINFVTRSLKEDGYVTSEFVVSLKDRERLGGTDLPSGTAIPHGNPSCVNRTIITVVKNKKKFKWEKYYVDIIFLISIARKDKQLTKNILSDIYNVVDNKDILSELRKQKNKEAFLNAIGEWNE